MGDRYELSRDINIFYYPKRLIEDKLCHLLSVIESNKGDKVVKNALEEEISQLSKCPQNIKESCR